MAVVKKTHQTTAPHNQIDTVRGKQIGQYFLHPEKLINLLSTVEKLNLTKYLS